ncbi:MAG TPA: response regulator transcription factor [Bryobacteraceae bacterium]|nr:response regulator transcription factor [Bryobacteraceae bacterium]
MEIIQQDRIRVLSVDDHKLMREGIAVMIEHERDLLLVSQAANGREAILQYREHRPDVTLMDLRMPDLNGFEALSAIRAEFPEARIILLTTFEVDEDIRRAREHGACGCLLKSLPAHHLIQAIREVHAGKTWVSAQAASR